MRHLFIVLLLIISIHSNAQDSACYLRLTKTFEENFTMYVCDYNDTILFGANGMIGQAKKTPINSCFLVADSTLADRLHEILMAKENLKNKVALVWHYNGVNETHYFNISLYKQSSYERYEKKRSKQKVYIVDDVAGKIKIRPKVNPPKGTNRYFIINNETSADTTNKYKPHDYDPSVSFSFNNIFINGSL